MHTVQKSRRGFWQISRGRDYKGCETLSWGNNCFGFYCSLINKFCKNFGGSVHFYTPFPPPAPPHPPSYLSVIEFWTISKCFFATFPGILKNWGFVVSQNWRGSMYTKIIVLKMFPWYFAVRLIKLRTHFRKCFLRDSNEKHWETQHGRVRVVSIDIYLCSSRLGHNFFGITKVAALAFKFTNLVPATSATLLASWFVAAMDRTNRQAGQSISDLYK